jgi:hypothetical protein
MVAQLDKPNLPSRTTMTKRITLTVTQGNNTVTIHDSLPDDSPWCAQAYLFHKFLLAQGYVLDDEAVGSDVEAYVYAADSLSEEW